MAVQAQLKYLEDRWDERQAATLDEPEMLRYRSNLLGSDLRITNFGGGNTSSKVEQVDPIDGQTRKILWVKGSGGDLGSIKRQGFATLYQDKLLALEEAYGGVELEDAMVDLYPLCTFGNNPVAASIDTPLHGFLPFAHVDHLHPDWGIALAASANGRSKMDEFNQEFGHTLAWLPWQRPGFELGLMLRRVVAETPGCDGVVLGGHGLFTWGETQRESYLSTITIIDQLGQFIERHGRSAGHKHFGGPRLQSRPDRKEIAMSIMPYLRGAVSRQQRWIGSFVDAKEVMDFVNSEGAETLAQLGTSCPDHFIRTKIRPMLLRWSPEDQPEELKSIIDRALESYRAEYAAYYAKHALPDSPALRDASPIVVLAPGIGMFCFGKNRTEARIVGEFYTNAIGVMRGAGSLGAGVTCTDIPQAGPAAAAGEFRTESNYVALPASEAFRIEYWKLEDAKIRRQPPEKELSRRVALVVGGGSGIGREAALLAAERGAHVVVADRDAAGAERVAEEIMAISGEEMVSWTLIDLRDRSAIRQTLRQTIERFGGLDILINTMVVVPSLSPEGGISDAQGPLTLEVNVTANHLLADEARSYFEEQGLDASMVLTSSADADVSTRGSEASDASKAALSQLVRELVVGMAPRVRVNGIWPATAVKGSTMFPRACAQAILFLAGPAARCTTGHVIPVDNSLLEASLG